jgi:hypothetical protein
MLMETWTLMTYSAPEPLVDMITDAPYSAGGAQDLTNYMTRDGHELRTPSGMEMTDEQLNQFHRESEENEHTRHIILSPKREMSEKELDRATRATMNEFTEDKPSAEWCYSVHSDDGENDVHVACTGDIDYSQQQGDMWLEKDDLTELQDEIAADHFKDHTTEPQRELMLDQGRDDELQREQALRSDGPALDNSAGRDDGAMAALNIAKEAARSDRSDLLGPDLETYEEEHEHDRGRSR